MGEIEAGLEQYRPGQWQRLDQEELKKIHMAFALGWRVNVSAGSLELEEVDYLEPVMNLYFEERYGT